MQNKRGLSESSDNESSDSDVLPLTRKRPRRMIIEDSSEEEGTTRQSWIWQEKKNTPIVWTYSETHGIKASVLTNLSKDPTILELFSIIFDNKLWDIIIMETNRFAYQEMNDECKRRKVDDNWYPVTLDEIKAYYALCILMSQVKKSNIQQYWTTRAVIETPIFRKTMPFKRFRQISRFLHFSNNETSDRNDRLRKVRPIINLWNEKFKEIYTPSEYISIDESLMKYKGRLAYKQYNPSKRARFGLKIYKLCEASTGFCHKFKIYTGQDKINVHDSASHNVVMDLSKSIINKGYTLFLDNWYSSPDLFLKLNQKRTNVIGTVRKNRKNMPGDIQKPVLKKGECVWRSCNNLIALRWKDKRDVYMISTKHESVEMVEQSDKKLQKVMKPNCIVEYNKGMGAVDHQDQMLFCFPIMRKAIKGYRKLFFYMSDMALLSTYIMHKIMHGRKKESYVQYRVKIAETILQNVRLPDYKTRGKSTSIEPLRLQAQYWAHFPKTIDSTARKKHPTRMCKVCYKHKIRSETKWECAKCEVALHLPECFRKYHTKEDF